MFCFALPASAPRAQEDADAQAREADDRATTVEARQHALTMLVALAHQLRDSGDLRGAARALNRAGRLRVKLNLLQDAVATHREALAILKQTPDPLTEIDSLNGLGEAQNQMSKCGEAQAALQQAISLSDQNNYPSGKAQALLTLSDCQNFSDHTLALSTAEEAQTLWRSLGNRRGLAQSYSIIGGYQLARNNVQQATQNYEAALNLWKELNVPNEEAEALINLGYAEYRKGAWLNVLTFLTQAQSLLDEKAEPYKMGQITAGLAEAFIESGLPETGLEKYRQALEYYRQTQNQRAVIVMTWGIGKAYYLSGNYPEALATLQQALTAAGAIKEPTVMAMCNDYLGRTYGAMSDRGAALEHFGLALDGYTKVGNPMEAARTRALMAQTYQQQGAFEKAREHYQTALESFRAIADRVNQSATLYALGTLELEQNDLSAAEDHLNQSIKVTENIRRISTSRDLTAAFSASVHERYQSYVECLMRQHQEHPSEGLAVRALETNELARGRSLAELLSATQTNLAPGIDPEFAGQERSLRQSLRVSEDYKVALLSKPYRKEELDELDQELARLAAEYKQVVDTIRRRYPSYGEISRPTGWTLRQIQDQVVADDQTVLLEYSLGAEKSYVWAVTNTKVTSYELPAQAQITEAAQRVYQLLKDKPGTDDPNGLTNAAQYLGRMVLSPVAAELNKHRIIVVADGALNYIPFQILPSPSADNSPLVTSYEVVNAPSASILGQLQQEAARRETPVNVLAAFGDPVFASNYAQQKETDGGKQVVLAQTNGNELWQHAVRDIEPSGDSFNPTALEPLFFTKRELANLSEVGGPETFVATGFDASREKLESADLTKYAILHFATHGILDPKRPENSGIVLSMVDRGGQPQNGFVGLQDIYSLRAPVNLVVLSACRTGLGKEVRGEGLIGLTRGFMYAGASSVMASLWKVDDEATAELMKRFYTNMLQGGMTPAAALGAAQNSIRQEPQWRAPYYWAAFTMQGEYRQVIRTAPSKAHRSYVWIFFVALLLSLAGLAWQYRRLRRTRTA